MNLAECTVGQELPELVLPIDRTTIVATAIASQDFEDVHHDPDAALGRGTPDVFMSINATNGFVDRYITDWTGPTARIRKVSLRLGVPAFPGDPMVMTGEITAVKDTTVTVKVQGRNSRGVHVSADVVVEPYGKGIR
ncbi:beta-hydroxyacyl-[acyl-carrier- protein] dehydratase subunit [Rhodococcus rhodochrous]|uniref:MaoC/PaaZ C-terminal domain-containing protein n=1 Tax=Rhodococcus rhodochrous TaxID=1829 RepID=UPI0007511FBF|nr:MaoC/PaaZ C-terminal domain-containing protein [Rhodococcus rhodochrous]MDO1484408.1 acyl dehydratase [Rhodococcus rhodochrous]SNV11645.1 beta-hydroxyacyl-[acyl-carrier- protein] dehydratase subunit [Rhodococcus rhodochrous]